MPQTEAEVQRAQRVIEALRAGRLVSDAFFDRVLSARARKASRRHWTPVGIAHRAAQLLTDGKPCRVLDIGSGAGKFCFIGALTTPAEFFGVEKRKWLVDEAKDTARRYHIARAAFLAGDMLDLDWAAFDAIYLYNPFFENIDEASWIDDKIPLGSNRYDDLIANARGKLATLRSGTRVVTFHGFGGEIPDGFEKKSHEPWGGEGALELFLKP